MKPTLKELKDKYPNVPDHCLPTQGRSKKQSPANKLTDDVINHIKSLGGYAWRNNTQGTYSERLGKYIYSGAERGVSDVIGCWHGLLLGVEIKIKDKQSDKQKAFQDNIEKAGGLYLIAKDIEGFKRELQSKLNRI